MRRAAALMPARHAGPGFALSRPAGPVTGTDFAGERRDPGPRATPGFLDRVHG